MGKIVVLLGKSGAGKSTIQRHLLRRLKLKNVVSTTTRPPRENERDGVDYHFITDYTYNKKQNKDKLLCARHYNTVYGEWKYAIQSDQIDLKHNWLCVLDCDGYRELIKHFGKDSVIGINITLDNKTRLIRTLMRSSGSDSEVNEIIRRYSDDEIVFKGIENEVDLTVENIDLHETEDRIVDFLCEVM